MSFLASSLPRSMSMQDIVKPSITEIIGTIISSWRPGFLFRTLLWQEQPLAKSRNPFASAVAALKAQFMNYESTIEALNSKIDDLEYDVKILDLENKTCEHEVANLHADIASATCDKILLERASKDDKNTIDALKLIAKQDQAKIKDLNLDLDNARKFISYMVDIDLHTINPLRNAANMTIDERMDAEDALLESITAASKRRGSVWSRIVPAIQGPRTPENYMSAINMTLQTRKELRHRERASRYWKEKAQLDPAHSDLVTPSSSDLDDLLGPEIYQKIADGDESVLDDLMDIVNPSGSFPSDFMVPLELKRVVEADAEMHPRRASHPTSTKIISTPTIIEPSQSSSSEMFADISQDDDDAFQELPLLHPAKNLKGPFVPLSSPSASSVYSLSSAASLATPRALAVNTFYQPETPQASKSSSTHSPSSSPTFYASASSHNQTNSVTKKDRPPTPSARPALRAIDTNRPRSNTTSSIPSASSSRWTKRNDEERTTNALLLEVPGSPSISSTSFDSDSIGVGRRASAKLLGKRNGVILAENQDIMTLSTPSTPTISATPYMNNAPTTTTQQSSNSHISITNIKIKSTPSVSQPPRDNRNSLDIARVAVQQVEEMARGPSITIQALESLESVLSSMSSDDLGSLEPSEAGDEDDDDDVEPTSRVENNQDDSEGDKLDEVELQESETPRAEEKELEEPRKKGPFEEEDPEDFADVSAISSRLEAGFRRSQETIAKLDEIRRILDIEFPLPETRASKETLGVTPASQLSRSETAEKLPASASKSSDSRQNLLVSSSVWVEAESSSDALCTSSSLDFGEDSDLSRTSESQDKTGETNSSDSDLPLTAMLISPENAPASPARFTPRPQRHSLKTNTKNSSKLPMMSGIARRFGRAVRSPADKENIKQLTSTARPAISSPRPAQMTKTMPLSNATNRTGQGAQKAVKPPTILGTTKRSSDDAPRASSLQSPARQKVSSLPTASPPKATIRKATSAKAAEQSLMSVPSAPAAQDPKVSVGRSILRHLSNIPGSKPRTTTSSLLPPSAANTRTTRRVPSPKPRSSTFGSPLPATFLTPSPQVLGDPSGKALIASRLESLSSTKPRSATLPSGLPASRKSPLAQTIVTVTASSTSSSSSDLDANDDKKPRKLTAGSQLPVARHVRSDISGSTRTGIASPTSTKFSKSAGRISKTPQPGKTATPVQRLSSDSVISKADKRRTNSVKPLIPAWSGNEKPTPAQCRNLFRNSLTMVR